MEQAKKAYLLLANGKVFEGCSFGAQGKAIGEVVFTTGVVGFQETLTDPSCCGQIITQTFPLVGNYGINGEDFESARSYAKGYIVREWCDAPSNFRMTEDLDQFLKEQGVIGLYGIDTRALTRILRENGAMNGCITTQLPEDKTQLLQEIADYRVTGAVEETACRESQSFPVEDSKYTIALYDFGYQYSIRRWLNRLGCSVVVVPPLTNAQEIKELHVDGIMLSNGPGDPAENQAIIANLKELAKTGLPILGAGLGHQMMALAMGGETAKMKHGHRGGNQPVTDLDFGTTFITSQNHGYTVTSIPQEIGRISHVNANDQTCEGVRYTAFPCVTVQFHPAVCSGPRDTDGLFREFAELIEKTKEDAVCR